MVVHAVGQLSVVVQDKPAPLPSFGSKHRIPVKPTPLPSFGSEHRIIQYENHPRGGLKTVLEGG